MPGTTHIIGTGLAGLSAATLLAKHGQHVILYEAASQAGGRCRSYDDAAFGATIDNGNHLLLSGNSVALSYLKMIGSADRFDHTNATYHFIDTQTGKNWILHPGEGTSFFWKLAKHRRLRHLILLSALNTHPREASSRLAMSVVCRSLLKGSNACIPMIAHGLSATFIDPALKLLEAHGNAIVFNRRLSHIKRSDNQADALDFSDGDKVELTADDHVICAVPSWNMSPLLPEIIIPDEHRGIVNAHFRIAPPIGFPPITGVLNAMVEWIFAFPQRISITISDADRLMPIQRETLARLLWQEVSAITGLSSVLPPWQIIKEKRATFAATSKQDKKRPSTNTKWHNLYLAGDWVQTGLPATMEGAILSGRRAAERILAKR